MSPSLSSKGQVQIVANHGREGIQRQGWSSQETILQPWGRVLTPLQGMHIALSLSSSAELKPPPEGRCYLLDEALFIPERRSEFAHHHLTPGDLWIEGKWALPHSDPYQ